MPETKLKRSSRKTLHLQSQLHPFRPQVSNSPQEYPQKYLYHPQYNKHYQYNPQQSTCPLLYCHKLFLQYPAVLYCQIMQFNPYKLYNLHHFYSPVLSQCQCLLYLVCLINIIPKYKENHSFVDFLKAWFNTSCLQYFQT